MATARTQHIAQAILEVTDGKSGKVLEQSFAQIIIFLSKKGMMRKSKEILTAFEALLDKKNHTIRAHIESAHKLDTKTLEHIESSLKKRYHAKEIHLDTKENKDNIGGIKIKVGEEVIDLTLRSHLEQLEQHLINT